MAVRLARGGLGAGGSGGAGAGAPHAQLMLCAGARACRLSQSMLSTPLQSKSPAHPPAAHIVPSSLQPYDACCVQAAVLSCRTSETLQGDATTEVRASSTRTSFIVWKLSQSGRASAYMSSAARGARSLLLPFPYVYY
jgi:hypothetical protein